ncbi:dynein regulatory complex protein 8 isoform X3 [Papio anubis]|uniref:dynein regulatory complex protein 8 isoform X3 n=1 Tax=Papio anubis TaxID=9555 RepID=UPI0012AE8F53|nr:dynein regulatory complex protein 8 isoform X3 [Papio anubis]
MVKGLPPAFAPATCSLQGILHPPVNVTSSSCILSILYPREIGTIIRSLGCCPTEGELHDLIAEVEEEEPTGYIRFEKFLPVMTEILLERRYRPIPEDVLLRAFEVLDSAKRGFLTKDELIKYMTEEACFKHFILGVSLGYPISDCDIFSNCYNFHFRYRDTCHLAPSMKSF